MRLWHKDLIKVLPQQQLISQWRELCCIVSNMIKYKTPNHILVNKILDYPASHFVRYTQLVLTEMNNRGYNVSKESLDKYNYNLNLVKEYFHSKDEEVKDEDIFKNWHNNRYLVQCHYNLQEKYDCGGISEDDYKKICDVVYFILT